MTSHEVDFAHSVARHVRTVGKHHLDRRFLLRLDSARAGLPDESLLRPFLDCALDKYEERYCYSSYLALPLIDAVRRTAGSRLTASDIAELLISDALRFEVAAAAEDPSFGAPRLGKRLRHGTRFITGSAGDGAGRAQDDADTVSGLPRMPETGAAAWLAVTVLPVHVLHDEYMFIRVLQAFEMVFTIARDDMRGAVASLRARQAGQAAERIGHAARWFDRAAVLFTLLATMDVEAFRVFRTYTEGASAIQSDRYKEFELRCGIPPGDRLDSAAFSNVPDVQKMAHSRNDQSLTTAYLDARQNGTSTDEDLALVEAAMAELENSHQRWKTTHHSLARRMLGDARGSGYTEGVPYLESCLDNRLFRHHPTAGTPGKE